MIDNPIYVNKETYTILYFLDYGKYFGGAVNTLLRQALLMKDAGYKIIIFFSDYFGKELHEEYKEIFREWQIEYTWGTYQITSHPEDVDVVCIDSNYARLKEQIIIYHPDILHSVQINPCVELISRELHIPHIMNIYPLIPEFFTLKYMDIFPKYHICDSWYWGKRWNAYLKTDYTCIRTVVNCENKFVTKELGNTQVQYICAGVLCAGKNQLNVIKAFHQALQEGISGTLSIYGYDEGAYAEECKYYVLNNNLLEWIHIKGFCPEMEWVYKKSDVLICGSTRESYPNVISEAMAYGLVVISTPVAGVPELMKDGENGYLAQDASAEAICRKIVEFNGDIGKTRLEEIRKNTYKTFQQNHSPDVVTKKLIAYYGHVVRDEQRNGTVRIAEIRQQFAALIHKYQQNYGRFTDPRKIALKLWYLYSNQENFREALHRGSAFYIWGTGTYGVVVREMTEVFLPELMISGFIDSNRSGTFFGYPVYKPLDILKKENVVVFVAAVNGQQEILSQVKDHGMAFNRDYFILSARVW